MDRPPVLATFALSGPKKAAERTSFDVMVIEQVASSLAEAAAGLQKGLLEAGSGVAEAAAAVAAKTAEVEKVEVQTNQCKSELEQAQAQHQESEAVFQAAAAELKAHSAEAKRLAKARDAARVDLERLDAGPLAAFEALRLATSKSAAGALGEPSLEPGQPWSGKDAGGTQELWESFAQAMELEFIDIYQISSDEFSSSAAAGGEPELGSRSPASARAGRGRRLPERCSLTSQHDGEGSLAVGPGHGARREIDVQVLLADGRTIGLTNVSPEETVEHLIARIEQADPQRGFLVGPRGKVWAKRDLRGNLSPDVRLVHQGATLRPNSPIEDVRMQRGALLKLIPGTAVFMDTSYVSRPEAKRPWVPRASPELARQKPVWTPPDSARAASSRAQSPALHPLFLKDDAGAAGKPAAGAQRLLAEPPPAAEPHARHRREPSEARAGFAGCSRAPAASCGPRRRGARVSARSTSATSLSAVGRRCAVCRSLEAEAQHSAESKARQSRGLAGCCARTVILSLPTCRVNRASPCCKFFLVASDDPEFSIVHSYRFLFLSPPPLMGPSPPRALALLPPAPYSLG
ncbi:unnamed protein product [Prorocentrum cordatum]|uniref:Uncharacterized protein n=1 Tax=Prorocentrum cordatum TaxID=2364126 RepID=A0ABN9VHH7_9DINO|nr:unnamed protein product [Polarella glacialis]